VSIELGTVQTGTGKVDPARKLKCTTAAHVLRSKILELINTKLLIVLGFTKCGLPFFFQYYPALCPKHAPIATTVKPTSSGPRDLDTLLLPGKPSNLMDINHTFKSITKIKI